MATAEANGTLAVADFYDIKSLGENLKCTGESKEELTHDMASEMLKAAAFVAERPLRERHGGLLLTHMQKGTFHWNLVKIITCRCKEPHNGHSASTVFRMNGQHTCWARLQMPASYRAPITVARYVAATEQDLRMLYSTIDRGAPRTKQNVINSYISGTEEYGDYHSHVRKYLPSGLALYKWEQPEHRVAHDGDDIAYLMLQGEAKLCHKVAGILDQFNAKEHRHIMRSPTVAAMFATMSRSEQKSIEFWTAVATGVGFSNQSDPRLKLRNMLMKVNVASGAGSRFAIRTNDCKSDAVSAEAMYRICVTAWNSFRQDKTVSQLRAPDRRPIAL